MSALSNRRPAVAIPTVDVNALKTNQMLIVLLTAGAFVAGVPVGAWIVGGVGLALAIGAARPGRGPFQVLYRRAILASGLVRPDRREDDPAPHRFAQAMGGTVLLIAAILLLAGATIAGWLLAWIVISLALVNLLFGFCAGCFLFLQAGRVFHDAGLAP